MPTTLTGLVLFVALLVPGFAYVTIRQRSIPALRASVFREVAQVAIVSVVAGVTALGACAIAAQTLPESKTPDIERLIREGREYVATDYAVLGLWAVSWLLVATAGALVFALLMAGTPAGTLSRTWKGMRTRGRISRITDRVRVGRTPHQSVMSSWWLLFDEWQQVHDGVGVTVSCMMDDGSWVQGVVSSYNTTADDISDRDLILRAPIEFGLPNHRQEAYDASAVCISARRIVTMFIWYDDPAGSTDPSEAAASAAPSSGVERS